MSEEEEIYDVERIIKDRVFRGKKQYLIKWLGYPESECTWEDEDNIYCDDLKVEYENGKKKSTNKKKETTAPKSKIKHYRVQVTNEWDDVLKKVVGVSKSANGTLEVEYVMIDGKKGVCDAGEIHAKAPIHLLEFYEANLMFPE